MDNRCDVVIDGHTGSNATFSEPRSMSFFDVLQSFCFFWALKREKPANYDAWGIFSPQNSELYSVINLTDLTSEHVCMLIDLKKWNATVFTAHVDLRSHV